MDKKIRRLQHIIDYDTEVVLSYDDNTTERFWDFSRALKFLEGEGLGKFSVVKTFFCQSQHQIEFENKQRAWYHSSHVTG